MQLPVAERNPDVLLRLDSEYGGIKRPDAAQRVLDTATEVCTARGRDSLLGRCHLRTGKKLLTKGDTKAALDAYSEGLGLVTAVGAGYWPDPPPAPLRWALLTTGWAAAGAALGWFALRAVFWRQSWTQTARFIEQALPEGRNDLINSVLLSGDTDQASPELVQLAIHEAIRRMKRVELRQSVSTRGLARWVLVAGLVGLALAAFAIFQSAAFRRGIGGAMMPTAYVERANELSLISVLPEDGATYFVGETVKIVATIRNDEAAAHRGEVILGDGSAAREMFPANGYTTFTLPLRDVQQSFDFAVRIGDSRWPADRPYYRVNILQRVQIDGLDLRYEYPPYTRLEGRTVRNTRTTSRRCTFTNMTYRLRMSRHGLLSAARGGCLRIGSGGSRIARY